MNDILSPDVLDHGPDPASAPPAATMERVRLEQGEAGAVLGTATPRISWQVRAPRPEWRTERAEVEYASADGTVRTATVPGDASVLVDWPFPPLASRERGTVRVRAVNGAHRTAWSTPAALESGLLEPSDWTAGFVSPVSLGGLDDGAPVLFRSFHLDRLPVRARLYITAHGVYEATLNGDRAGDDVLAPGWTSYPHRLRYQAYDVADSLHLGQNTLSAVLGNGWYRGQLVWPGNRSSYGDRLALLAQLELDFADGSREIVGTDERWRASAGAILFDDLYDGERRDLRRTNAPDPAHSEPVELVPGERSRLVARRGPSVRVTERVRPVAITTSPSGATIVDFGQNLVGWVELTVHGGRPGDEVAVRHAEVLERDELAMRPLRSAKATCSYVLSDAPTQTLRPTFTFNGFRYAEISGIDGLDPEDVTALVLGSDLERTGWLETSDPLLNQLHENIVWGMRGNFLDLPTDCPQRDERLGWTGDIGVFAATANYLFDTSGFLAGWLEDLAADQHPDGGVPYVVPDVLRDEHPAAAAWSDAATIVPAALYRSYADRGVLERQYDSMRAWVGKVTSLAPQRLWTGGFQFGDWLDPTAPPEEPSRAAADPDVVATAYYARSARLVAEAARELGHGEDADSYGRLADEVAAAFDRAYVGADGAVQSDCQTVYALALCWDLVADESARQAAGERLAELVTAAGYRVATGFVGTPLVLDALCRAGRTDVAYEMLLQTQPPSWLYAVTMGATTVWERWDSMLPDGSVNPGSMTSFNHYAYGAVADWMHRSIGGLAPAAPGWKRVLVRPLTTGPLRWARAAYDSPYGRIACSWRREALGVDLEVHVPTGITAEVWVPGADSPVVVGAGVHRFAGSAA